MKKIFSAFLIADIIAVNIAVGYLFFLSVTESDNSNLPIEKYSDNTSIFEQTDNVLECNELCLQEIEKAVEEIKNESKIITPNFVPTAGIIKEKVKTTSYIPIPGSGNTSSTSWTDLPGTDFYFTKSDYAGYKESYLEINMKLANGNGMGYVRLFDVTNGRGVDGSEVTTSSQTSIFAGSKNLSIWEGFNHYRIQIKSLSSDTVFFESGRIKILTEN